MPELNEEDEAVFRCPHCEREIEELNYSANFSENCYGHSSGTYCFSGNEDTEECADGDHECQDQDNQDSDNWEEDNYKYFCPECEREVEPMDCIVRGKQEIRPDSTFKFKVGEEVIYRAQKNFSPTGEMIEYRAKITKRGWDRHTVSNVYMINCESSAFNQLSKSVVEAKLEKIGNEPSEWGFSISKNDCPMIRSEINQKALEGTCICPQCNYAFVVNQRSGQTDDMNECPQCNSIITQ